MHDIGTIFSIKHKFTIGKYEITERAYIVGINKLYDILLAKYEALEKILTTWNSLIFSL